MNFAIIEIEDGSTIVELQPGVEAEAATAREGGVLVDPGPYPTYDDAYDALVDLEEDDDRD